MLRLDLAQYNELKAFAQFGSELDAQTQAQLARGERMVEALNQGQYVPMPVEEQVTVIFAATQGYLDTIEVERVADFNNGLRDLMRSQHEDILKAIREEKDLSEETDKKLRVALEAYVEDFGPGQAEIETPAPLAAE